MGSEKLRVIISGGGTGGHIYPAIAIANALKEVRPDVEILFVGADGKMEMEKVPKAGFRIIGLPVSGFHRSWSPANLLFPFKLLNSLWIARKVIREFRPQAAIGVGGFASGPLLFIASLSGIPTLIQEQNSFAGITNRLLAKKANRICVAYPDMQKFFPADKILLTGNPVRKDITNLEGKRAKGLDFFGLTGKGSILFVMGGSLGARSINESIAANVVSLAGRGIEIIWQTGKLFIDRANEIIKRENLSDRVKAFDFIEKMDLAYATADVIVSRAGALSVSEICLAGKPSILIPYPYAAEDHQTANAAALVSKNAARLVKDSETDNQLADQIIELTEDPGLQQLLAKNCRAMGRADADQVIAAEVLKLVESKK